MSLREFTPPDHILIDKKKKSVFFGGTIDMGDSDDWQFELKMTLRDAGFFIDIYNPRRHDWNKDWEQSIKNPNFYQQVHWEIDAMNKADIIAMCFMPKSRSPISLLELGYFARSGKLIVYCPYQFYRSGNVHIICNMHNIPIYTNYTDFVKGLKETLKEYIK